ncbi:complement C1q tumor necrosis factor-related protein 6-like isoform X1 [Carassius auratus]|uniref:Complement C1q tumor necrosis factor-related protein 6-like n=1 Tax=Carassius auratus TaxID=7957 RepID=A0A6P6MPW2_CARAU|nr:complement C1q tumor necrosis factor-related protein 6-like [Carassius auratus]XP_026098344.1 complement C1q tumor necrosis factor-related protein 6-like isoform X1 [Carassius auratus]
MSYSTLYLLLIVLFSCNCSSMSEPQEKEKEELTGRSGLPVESGAAGNQQSCLITGLYPLLAELSSTLQSLKASLEQEQFRRKEEHNVAFSASLGNRGDVGPFNTDVTLVYQNVFVNAGSHYNTGTGIFTAPVKGVYFFSLSGHNKTTKPMGLRLFKNGSQMTIIYNYALSDAGIRYETLSNSITLMLEKGDQVSVHLLANTWVFDNTDNLTLFTGHLVFPF